MKHGIIKAVWLVALVCIAVFSASGDDRTTNLTAIVMESFDGNTDHEYNVGRHRGAIPHFKVC